PRDRSLPQQLSDRRRHRVHQPHVRSRPQLAQPQRVPDQDHPAASCQRYEQLVDRQVEADRRPRQHSLQLLSLQRPQPPPPHPPGSGSGHLLIASPCSSSHSPVSSTSAPESDSMYASRSSGYSGSSGTYAPPAFSTPSSPTTSSGPRSSLTPTRLSGPTPSSRSRQASRFALRFSSPYVSSTSPQTSATASGRLLACSSNSSWILPPPCSRSVRFHSRSCS